MDALMQFEITITLFFQHLGSWLKYPFFAVTSLGYEEFYILAMPALYWCYDAVLGFRLGIMLVFTNVINGSLKLILHSPRPYWVDSRVKAFSSESSFGFPSGHAQNAASNWGLVACSLKKKWLTILSIILIILIGLSRIYLGVHFTRDVVGGWLLGGLILMLFIYLERPVTRWIAPKTLPIKILISFLLSILIILFGTLSKMSMGAWQIPSEWLKLAAASSGGLPDPLNMEGFYTLAGVWFGFAAGYIWLLQKKGSIKISGSWKKRLARYLVGMAGVAILYLGLSLIFPTSPVWAAFLFRYIRYALLGFWIAGVAPLVFEKIHLDE